MKKPVCGCSTCIVAVREDDQIVMGGDSAGAYSDLSVRTRQDEKVFINNGFIIGFTTSFRMGQLLRYSFKPPKHPNGMPDMEYLVSKFIEEVRKCFTDAGYANGTFIVGYRGEIYTVEGDFQVGHGLDNYAAVGCGAYYALGALYASENKKMTADARVTLALSAAEKFSGGVGKPFNILHLPNSLTKSNKAKKK